MPGQKKHTPPRWEDLCNNQQQFLANLDSKEWVANQLRMASSQYLERREITVAVCSWNVDQSRPQQSKWLSKWLQVPARPDIIAVGLQEVDMSMMAMKNQVTHAHEPWLKAIRQELGLSDFEKEPPYVELKYRQLVGLFLVVYVSAALHPHVSEVELQCVCTGAISGALGNKGGIGVSFRLFASQICIINAHLAAHMEAVDKRNKNHQQIMRQMAFPKASADGPLPPMEHDLCLFFGDLNYRIGGLLYEQVVAGIERQDWALLRRNDQLDLQLAQPYWDGWAAATPLFPPSYRYDAGTDTYDTSEKRRTPAWTDRVLWYVKPVHKNAVQPLAYTTYKDLRWSDHKPVGCLLRCAVQAEVEARKAEVRAQIEAQLSRRHDAELAPRATVDREELDFGVVALNAPVSRTFDLTNTGNWVLEFVVATSGHPAAGACILVDPVSSIVFPGQACTVTVTYYLQAPEVHEYLLSVAKGELGAGEAAATATATAAGGGKADGSFTLRVPLVVVMNGGSKTLVVEASAHHTPAAFGNALGTLVQLREAPIAEYYALKHHAAEKRPPSPVPKELWYLTDFVYAKYAIKESRQFFASDGLLEEGSAAEAAAIREHLDRKHGKLDGLRVRAPAVLEALFAFLRDLTPPVVPYELYQKALAASRVGRERADKDVVPHLPAPHFNAFFYLVSLLRFIAQQSTPEGSSTFIRGFAEVMLRPPEGSGFADEDLDARAAFLLLFLPDCRLLPPRAAPLADAR